MQIKVHRSQMRQTKILMNVKKNWKIISKNEREFKNIWLENTLFFGRVRVVSINSRECNVTGHPIHLALLAVHSPPDFPYTLVEFFARAERMRRLQLNLSRIAVGVVCTG